jgi:hypothetical protein
MNIQKEKICVMRKTYANLSSLIANLTSELRNERFRASTRPF